MITVKGALWHQKAGFRVLGKENARTFVQAFGRKAHRGPGDSSAWDTALLDAPLAILGELSSDRGLHKVPMLESCPQSWFRIKAPKLRLGGLVAGLHAPSEGI
jgi:hypothetical protein